MADAGRPIAPSDFLNKDGRRMLTDQGAPGLDGRPGYGTAKDIGLASVGAILYAHSKHLNDDDLDVIQDWLEMYRTK